MSWIVSVEQVLGHAAVDGRLESPAGQTRIHDEALLLSGWALGTERPVVAIELVRGDRVPERIKVDQERLDVAAAFPESAGAATSGFRHLVATADLGGGEVVVRALLDGGRQAPLARLRLREAPLLDPADLLPGPVGDYDLTTAEAVLRYRSSPVTRWAKLMTDDPPPGSAWQRISDSEFFEPLIAPEFAISPDDRVFAIGSCFARGVEGALESLGVDVVSRTDVFDHLPIRATGYPIGYTNKYNIEAIRNELRWALEPGEEFPRDSLLRLPDGRFQDPHASPILEYSDEVNTIERHRLLTKLTREVASCRIVVVTLGLIEAFLDTTTGLYTNTTPHLTADPDRFRFRVLSYEQIMDRLEEVYKLLSTHGHPDVRIVVTVSPVPLEATFTGQDVVLANTVSKAVLRAAVGAWTPRHENVHYFPSYEIVMNSDKAAVWEKDGRHVRPLFVRRIMDLFVRTHLSVREPEPLQLVGDPRESAGTWTAV